MNNIPQVKTQDLGKTVLYGINTYKPSDLTYKIISGHHFNSSMNILLPHYSSNSPVDYNHNIREIITVDNEEEENISKADPSIPIPEMPYYEIYGQLHLIFEENFLLNVLLPSNSIHIFSKDTSLTDDNCFCYLPEGVLYMSIDKDTYYTLGLQGHHSIFRILNESRYIIEIHIKDYYQKHGCLSPYLKHIASCFEAIPPMTFLFYGEELEHISFPSSYQITSHTCQQSSFQIQDSYIPFFTLEDLKAATNPQSTDSLSFLQSLIEWIGIASFPILKVLCNKTNKSKYSEFCLPSELRYIHESSLSLTHYLGSFSSSFVLQTIDKLLTYIQEHDIPWFILSVNGEINTPCCWVFPKNKFAEHQYLYNGDNNYILILFKNGQCVLILDTGDMEQYV